MCGWAQGCSTADVDALLFGALTVYRTLTLSTSIPKNTQMARCCREAVQRVLGLERGGTQVGRLGSSRPQQEAAACLSGQGGKQSTLQYVSTHARAHAHARTHKSPLRARHS
jgi:hypothetical protein